MKKPNNHDSFFAGLVILMVIILYAYLGEKVARIATETNEKVQHFKTLDDLLNGNS